MKPVKTFIICCSSLLILAAITGIVDYANASKTGKLKTLYKEDQPTLATTLINKEIEVEDYSRAPIETQPAITKIDNLNNQVRNVKYRADYASKNRNSIAKKKTNKARKATRKKEIKEDNEFSLRSFSRAPLRKFKKEIIAEPVIDSVNVQ